MSCVIWLEGLLFQLYGYQYHDIMLYVEQRNLMGAPTDAICAWQVWGWWSHAFDDNLFSETHYYDPITWEVEDPQASNSRECVGLCLAKALTSRTRRHFSKCLWNCKVKKRLMHTHLRMRVFEWRAQQQVLICRPSCSRPIWWIRTGRRMLIRDSEGWTCLRRKGSILQIHVAESELDE